MAPLLTMDSVTKPSKKTSSKSKKSKFTIHKELRTKFGQKHLHNVDVWELEVGQSLQNRTTSPFWRDETFVALTWNPEEYRV